MSSLSVSALGNGPAPLGASGCCKMCSMGGCDVKITSCGCCLHARCCPVSEKRLLTVCPICQQAATSLQLLPMNFEEIDHAKRQAALTAVSDKRGKKRKNLTIARLTGNLMDESVAPASSGSSNGDDLRTGRWTREETEYCDALIKMFEEGSLPIPEGLKLNEFLARMLKSKQSRLTKKMKNARLSSRQYKPGLGFIEGAVKAQSFSQLETQFFASIKCALERSEIRFHMQKEWRELFSTYCASVGQVLDANSWLYSVEELDRRASMQKDRERMVRRKVMMGHALNHDAIDSSSRGVYIEAPRSSVVSNLPEAAAVSQTSLTTHELAKQDRNPMKEYASPFIGKIMEIVKRHAIPFEHVDAWVPSFVAGKAEPGQPEGEQQCRLCFAGCGTTEEKIPLDGSEPVPLTAEEKFHLLSFGDYSQKFSFDVGSGLPGRVYSSGVASWEQGIQNAPLEKFERCGGALQWGIQTVLGIPIPSPSVGRIVVVFYSVHDRSRLLALVNRIAEDLGKLRPSPKWKLVVDVGVAAPSKSQSLTDEESELQRCLLDVIDKGMPADKNSPHASYLPGFTSLRLLLTRLNRSPRDEELLKSILVSFQTYKKSGRSDVEIASMVARDFMHITTPATIANKAVFPQQYPAPQIQGAQPVQTSVPYMVSVDPNQPKSVPRQVKTQQLPPATAFSTAVPPKSDTTEQKPDHSLPTSPAMQPIPAGSQADTANFNLSTNHLSAFLQQDAMHFQGGA